jgi:fatty-acid desaturase
MRKLFSPWPKNFVKQEVWGIYALIGLVSLLFIYTLISNQYAFSLAAAILAICLLALAKFILNSYRK